MHNGRHQRILLLLTLLFPLFCGCGRELPYGTVTRTSFAMRDFPGGTLRTAVTAGTNARGDEPGVLILPGSPADMDWNFGPLVTNTGILLTRQLAMRGLRVLRYDPPGRGGSTLETELTPERSVAALATAHRLLAGANRPVWWIAHGDAALTALLAARSLKPRGIILLSPPGVSMGEVLLQQAKEGLENRRVEAGRVAATLAYLRAGIKALVAGEPRPAVPELVEAGAVLAITRLFHPGQRAFARWMMVTAPPELVPPLPRIAIWGGHDRHYPGTLHARYWQKKGVRTMTIPGMDHMLRLRTLGSAAVTPRAVLQSYTATEHPLPAALLDTICREIGVQ